MFSRLPIKKRLQIQYLKKKGHSARDIAKRVECSVPTVLLWSKKEFGITNENQRSGRKSKVTKRKKRQIIRQILSNSTSLRKLAVQHKILRETVRIIIKSNSPNDPIISYKRKKNQGKNLLGCCVII